MLEKTEGPIKNGQSRETGNIGYCKIHPINNQPINMSLTLANMISI